MMTEPRLELPEPYNIPIYNDFDFLFIRYYDLPKQEREALRSWLVNYGKTKPQLGTTPEDGVYVCDYLAWIHKNKNGYSTAKGSYSNAI